ncbi:MAG TPA: class II aldolase/adducin family protein [Acidimicrobiia bacterium]|nr:class II aldolase/adducin family protein [Acidimicrobiia bacterium]
MTIDAGPTASGDVEVAAHDRTFAWNGDAGEPLSKWFAEGLRARMLDAGYRECPEPGPDVHVVLHHVDPAKPRPYRRKAAPTFVVAIMPLAAPPDDVLRAGYPVLVRALANVAVLLSDGPDGRAAHFVTLEQGTYTVRERDGADEPAFFERVFARVEPLAMSRLVIANEFVDDLPIELWDGDEQTRQIRRAGERLAALDLLPAAFPIEEILPPRDLRHVKLLYGIGGLSYGNVSARFRGDPVESSATGPAFWMSASGVDKGDLRVVGEHVLLVRGYDPRLGAMVLSVPPNVTPRRVSVDAIEHWKIYREHPDVGAILHVHAWMDGVRATEINYPCGTLELADAVADLVRADPDPSHAVVGQRNHGLTITGPTLDEIFERIDGRIVRNVPMD